MTALLTLLNFACWGLCFWWMHRISKRQDSLLSALKEQGGRIERLSKDEHDLLREMHPAVKDIRAGIADVQESVDEQSSAKNS
jgi:hypothetical protein